MYQKKKKDERISQEHMKQLEGPLTGKNNSN